MFSGFWGWFLVVVIVAVIFGAGKLPELKEQAQDKLKLLAQAAEKGCAFSSERVSLRSAPCGRCRRPPRRSLRAGCFSEVHAPGKTILLFCAPCAARNSARPSADTVSITCAKTSDTQFL